MEILITSIVAFASTNIDDIFLLTLFFGNKKFRDNEIIAGQFLGITTLITISLIGSLIGLIIDQAFVGLLGVVPIYLGVKALWGLFKKGTEGEIENEDRSTNKNNVFTVAGVTIANGGDNIGIYIPLFTTLTWTNKAYMITVFLAMTFLWCMTAKHFTKHPYMARSVEKYGHLITPFVLILLGLYIMYENGTFNLLRATS